MSDIVIRAVVSPSPVIKPSNAAGPQGIQGPKGENGDVVGPETSVGDNFASWDGTGGNTLKDSGKKPADFLESVIDDTTPQLGGNLDVNGKTFTQTASAKYEFGTDEKQVDFNSNNAHFTLVNNTTGTAIDWRKGNKQTIAPTTAPTYTFTAPGGACSLILKLTQHSTAVTITWPATVKWCGSTPAFDTNSGVYIICFFYDGTNYYGTSVEEVSV